MEKKQNTDRYIFDARDQNMYSYSWDSLYTCIRQNVFLSWLHIESLMQKYNSTDLFRSSILKVSTAVMIANFLKEDGT